jgi:hypothetical protein
LLENGKTIKHATSENSKFGSCGSVDNCGSSAGKYLGPASCGVPNLRLGRQIRIRRQFIGSSAPSAALSANSAPSAIRLRRQFCSIGNSAPLAALSKKVGKFGSVGTSSAIQLRRRLRQQIRLRRQFGSVGNFAPSVIRLHWRLCPKFLIRWQIWLGRHFIGNSAPSAAPS